jgi:lipopolysaccharide/colanic/teichoic acid biosynthesis glycosyltransferase
VPVFLLVGCAIALWIKIVSPGPVFFRQSRVGAGGVRFWLWKFRTMHVDAETASHEHHLAALLAAGGTAPMTKLDRTGDVRIIRGGRFLRGLGLDELPQVFNVWRGEMSLVGPRPCLPYEFERYSPNQRARVAVVPGLTGYWQVHGKNRTTFAEMIEMDIWYTQNLSLWLDLEIIARTVPALLAQAFEKRLAIATAAAAVTAAATSASSVISKNDTENLETENLILENE